MSPTRNTTTTPLIHTLQQRTVERFGARLRHLFDRLDVVFFDLADNAGSNNDQNEYFQAMRHLRMQRADIEALFKAALIEGFQRFLSPPDRRSEAPLCLEAQDIQLTLEDMAGRVQAQFPAALLQLQTKLQILVPESATDLALNPLAPRTLCLAFERSLRSLEIDNNPRLVIFKHFERDVLPELGPLLRDAQELLRSVGTPAQTRLPKPSTSSPSSTQNFHGAGRNFFQQKLDQLQQQLLVLEQNATPNARDDWRHSVRQSAQNSQQENAINTVFMLFEYLLERQELSSPLATAFARLQIPVIKVALQDPQFFREQAHPARRLLKTLTQATLGWDTNTDADDPLPAALDYAVKRILHEYHEQNTDLFLHVEQEFLDAIVGQEHRLKRAGERIRASVAGRRVVQQARATVERLLLDRLQGKTVPENFLDIVGGPWSLWLQYCWQQHGNASPPWRYALTLTDDLIWSVQPPKDEADRQRWMKRVPLLVKEVTDALAQKLSAVERDQAVESLWLIHAAILKGDNTLPTRTLDFTFEDELSTDELPDVPLQEGQWVEWHNEDAKPQILQLALKGDADTPWTFLDRQGRTAIEADGALIYSWWQQGKLTPATANDLWEKAIALLTRKPPRSEKSKL